MFRTDEVSVSMLIEPAVEELEVKKMNMRSFSDALELRDL